MNRNSNRVFDHVFIIMFENQYRSYVMENEYFKGLSRQGIDMANYFGVMHPSQTNYISSLAAELCNMTDDDPPPNGLLPQDTIVDLIEKSPYNLDWRAYMDSYIPQNQAWTPTLQPKDEYPYVIKHNAFSSFAKIVRNEERWKKVQNESALFSDLLNGTLPAYSWFTPNMWNDGHYLNGTNPEDKTLVQPPQPTERAPTLVDQAAAWLEGFFERMKFPGPDSHFPPNTLVVVTYDEADFEAAFDPPASKKYFYDGPNQIYTVLLGDMIEPGGVSYEGFNHYSLIKTIEHNFGLGSLGKNDKDANWFKFLWDETFIWEAPEETPLQTAGQIASAALDEALYVVYDAGEGELRYSTLDGEFWSEPQPVGISSKGSLAMATFNNQLYMAAVGDDGAVSCLTYSIEQGWSKPAKLVASWAVKVTMAAINDGAQLMLVYTDEKGNMNSMVADVQGTWGKAVSVGFATQGELQLGVLGANVMLMYQDVSTHQVMICTYNTADYNVVTLQTSKYNGPWSNTTKDKWSPSVYPVQHFSAAAYKGTAKEKEPVSQPYQASGPLACATLDGLLHLAHPGVGNNLMLTEEFSIHGTMTPEKAISYDPADNTTTNTGYGTLAQAGWSEQGPINGAYVSSVSTMSTVDGEVILIYDNGEGYLDMVRGGY